MPNIKSTVDENGDASPDTIIRAGTEIYKPLLEASTGSTAIPLKNEEQVSHGQTQYIMSSPSPHLPQILPPILWYPQHRAHSS